MLLSLLNALVSASLAVSAAERAPNVDGFAATHVDDNALSHELSVSGLPSHAPMRVRATATEARLVVEVALEPGWHLYSRDVGGGRPVAIALDDDSPFVPAGELDAPGDAKGEIAGKAQIVLPLRRARPGHTIAATFDLQICDALECLEPMTLTLQGEVAPTSVLLVVAEEDERAERIRAWLESRDFRTSMVNYADVTAEQCDQHDVVIADSHYYGEQRIDRKLIHAFPQATSPIVAVGFLGTELVEAHGVAMTSGYI